MTADRHDPGPREGVGWLPRGRPARVLLGTSAVVLTAVVLWLDAEPGARSSSLSRRGDGWWAVRAYLEGRGVEARRIDRPLVDAEDPTAAAPGSGPGFVPGRGVLVFGLPFQRPVSTAEAAVVGRHLQLGGDVVVGYEHDRFGVSSPALWRALGILGTAELRSRPPLAPAAWWRHRTARWTLAADPGFAEAPALEVPAFDFAPTPPPGAQILYRAPAEPQAPGSTPAEPGQRAVVFLHRQGAGRVVVLPASLFSNRELRRASNADLAETLLQGLAAGPWWFDEVHHGVVAAGATPSGRHAARAWDLFVGHLALLYLLGALALARRFGPVWTEPVRRHGSAATFLRNLGVLHHELGHHREAAELLVRRAGELDRRPPAELRDLLEEARAVASGEDLVRLALRVPRTATNRPAHPPSLDPEAP